VRKKKRKKEKYFLDLERSELGMLGNSEKFTYQTYRVRWSPFPKSRRK